MHTSRRQALKIGLSGIATAVVATVAPEGVAADVPYSRLVHLMPMPLRVKPGVTNWLVTVERGFKPESLGFGPANEAWKGDEIESYWRQPRENDGVLIVRSMLIDGEPQLEGLLPAPVGDLTFPSTGDIRQHLRAPRTGGQVAFEVFNPTDDTWNLHLCMSGLPID